MINTAVAKVNTENNETPPILVFDNYTNLKNTNYQIKQYRNSNKLTPKLNASASAQPNLPDFQIIFEKTNLPPKQIFIIDLRQEPHTILNGYAVSWYGFRNQLPYDLEANLIQQLSNKKHTRVYKSLDKLIDGYVIPKGYSIITINQVITEKFLIEKMLHANYFRILVTDHFAPNNEQVDLFINFIKQLPENSWLHFHCRGGKGRSTTFMVMYDIIKNGDNLSLQNIIKRQYKLGGTNLSKVNSLLDRNKWKETTIKNRYNFIKTFYEYVTDPQGYAINSWTEWLKNNNISI